LLRTTGQISTEPKKTGLSRTNYEQFIWIKTKLEYIEPVEIIIYELRYTYYKII